MQAFGEFFFFFHHGPCALPARIMLRKQALNNLTFTVPKNRKPKFDLTLRIIDLTNIPLVSGTAYVKWHISSSGTTESRGYTDKTPIIEHKAIWNFKKELAVRLTIDKNGVLQERLMHFEVIQEFNQGGRGNSRVYLGSVRLNLAEYARPPKEATDRDPQDEGDEGTITRRYLLQESKVNSTLKVGIKMKQTEGDTNFIAPPLRSAMVIQGIAGVLSAEVGEGDDIPSMTSKTRELSEAQDIYRRTLAATWACQAGELPPDKLVEEIFQGGDGGQLPVPPKSSLASRPRSTEESSLSSSSDETTRPVTPRQHLTPQMASRGHRRGASTDSPKAQPNQVSTVSGRSSIDQQVHASQQEHRRRSRPQFHERTEFELRDDLRSWQVRAN